MSVTCITWQRPWGAALAPLRVLPLVGLEVAEGLRWDLGKVKTGIRKVFVYSVAPKLASVVSLLIF